MMRSRLFRATTATALAVSLWSSTLLAQSQDTQDLPPPPPPKAKPAEPAPAQQPAPAKQNPAPPAKQVPAKSAKPLSADEDPALIGKRKLNSGLIASMSGSLEKEVALGRQIAAEVERELKMVDDPTITEYVNRVGQNIVLHSDAKVPFTIKVVDSDEINAFALPGGFFFVNKGLILAADNESELAGVMAHEIAHVAARHAMEQQAKGMLAQIGLTAASIFIPGTLAGAGIFNGAQILTTLGFLKFSRAAENEADKLGVQYLYAAGYDPNGMATMFEKLAAQNKKKPGKLARLFSTHPQSTDRHDASIALAARFPEREEYVISTSEFQKVKGRLLRLSNARATTSGAIADDGDSGRPTLKRRVPTGDGTTPESDAQKPEAPTMKGGSEAKPKPTPTPEN
jgi:predicted Zn-dependent protease